MGAFKLGKMTFGSLFKKPETVQYPFQEKPKPQGLKGHIAIDVNDCILCGMCERSCAADCIVVDKKAATWQIDRYGCIQCGYCITVCPKKCLHMDPQYAPAATARTPESFDVPTQAKAAASSTPEKSPVKPAEARGSVADAKTEEPIQHDEQLEALLSMMDSDDAEKVRLALQN